MLRLNIGSGQRKFGPDGNWTNIDINYKWTPDVIADGAWMPMFADNSADVIVLHHILEHYGCGEGMPVIQECHRILAPSGSLLVFVPDMWALAGAWREGRLSDQLYFTNVFGAYMSDEADRHKFGFTKNSLYSALSRVFTKVIPFDWRKIEGMDAAKDWWVLHAEAIK
jgi:predicted SAM-dependent methyltransferase